jgi:hypothetical protein
VGEVKLGATNMQEIAERVTVIFKERLTTLSVHGASFTAKSGELVEASAAITVTLPAAAANAVVGVLANGHEVTIGAGGALIYGDFVEGKTPIKLVGFQHVVLVSDGVNWFIVAGEPKRENVYGAPTERATGAEFEPSGTRPVFVSMWAFRTAAESYSIEVLVGGVEVAKISADAEANQVRGTSFICPPGIKWQAKATSGSPKVFTSYYVL